MARPKGEGCPHLYTTALNASVQTYNRRYRCCTLRGGFMLKMWRCVGEDDPECPKHPDHAEWQKKRVEDEGEGE